MEFSNKHKALCMTFMITGTLILGLFNFQVKQSDKRNSETYYELTNFKENLKEKKQLEAETNKAYNQTIKSKRIAQVYKRITPPKNYIRPKFKSNENGHKINTLTPNESHQIEKEERESFKKANDILKKQLEDKNNNDNSTTSYSLVNRTHRYIPKPIYLCESSGKIVVNITVNAYGEVIDSNYNNASNSSNQCLIEHALEYANKSRFNSDRSKLSQLGTITFYFVGKR